jgi:O-antigen/teichoic acid export membrane protein
MGMLFISFLDILVTFGVDLALIQRRDPTREHYDTAWTLRLLQVTFVALCVNLVTPLAVDYFNEPRVTDLMRLLSVAIVISGLENIGVVAFRKDLEFGKEFRFRVMAKLSSFVVTLLLALWLRNYWALAWGTVFDRTITVLLSYRLHPYRPRFSLVKIRDIWSFSQWMLLRNVGMYLRRQLDGWMVGRFFSTGQMGFYSVSKEVAQLPTTEMVWPMARALFPGYARLSHDPKRLGRAYLQVLGAMTLAVVPAGLGVALVAGPLATVFLGDKWAGVAPILAWLAVYSVFQTISATVQGPLMALGRMRRLVALIWTQGLLAAPAIVLAASSGDMVVLAQVQSLMALLLLPLFFYALTSLDLIRWGGALSRTWRPVAAGLAMAAGLWAIGDGWTSSPVLELAVEVPAGVALYGSTIYLLWLLSGRPDSAEQLVLDLLRQKILRGRSRPTAG